MNTPTRLPLARMAPFILLLAAACGSDGPVSQPLNDDPPCTRVLRFDAGEQVPTTYFEYDEMRRQISSETRSDTLGVTARTSTTYDAEGFVTEEREALRAGATTLDNVTVTTYVYDAEHLSYSATVTENGTVTEHIEAMLNAAGQPTRLRFASGRVDTFEYDAAGREIQRRIVASVGALEAVTTTTYDSAGRIARSVERFSTDPEKVTTYTYEGALLIRKQRVDPVTGEVAGLWTEYEYDAKRRLVMETTYIPAIEADDFNMQTEYGYACWDEDAL